MVNGRSSIFAVFAAAALSASLAVAGCGGGGSGLPTMGMQGMPSAAVVAENILLVDAALDGHAGGRLLVDTGSPFTLVNPSVFAGATLPQQTQVTIDLTFGALTVDHIPALQVSSGTMNSLNLGGIVGGDVLRQFSTQLNYRDQQLRLGAGPDAADVAVPGTTLSFKLKGGGLAQITATTKVMYPATRIPVTVNIEGTDHAFIVDTGASEVTVRTSLFAALLADGRPSLTGLPISTAAGAATATVARLRSVSVAGEMVAGVPVMSLGNDTLIDTVGQEVGQTLDGLLGGSFLREFLVTIDYPKGALRLQRYANRGHILDEFQRVGIALGAGSGRNQYVVAAVFAGSDAAAKQINVNDEVLSVDGQALSAFDAAAAEILLFGAVGSVHQLGLGRAAVASLSNTAITVRVDDLIPAN